MRRAGRDTVRPWVAGVMARAIAAGQLKGASPHDMAETWFALLIGDLQIRRVTGALQMPDDAALAARAGLALAQLRQLFAGS